MFGSLGNYATKALMKDDITGEPVVNYGLAVVALPCLLVGAFIGVNLNAIIPNIFLVLILLYVIYGSLISCIDRLK